LSPVSFTNIISPLKRAFAILADIRSPFHKRFLAFLFFVLLSAVFWFFRSLSNEYETEIQYPVRYVNIPENKVMLGTMPEKLTLMVNAKGRKLLLGKMKLNLIPIKFDVNSFIQHKPTSDSLFILTNSIKDILSEELENMKIISISPDTLFFRFTPVIVRKVAIRPVFHDQQHLFAPQYMINGTVWTDPDSLIISGPKNLLAGISYIKTESLDITGISDTVTLSCTLEKLPGISYSQKKVRVTIPVDSYTQAEYFLPVVTMNLPDSLEIKTFPERIRVTFNITLHNYNKIESGQVTPHINYEEILKSPSSRLRLFLPDTPHMVSAIMFSPEKVEYLLTRK
jgi:hypothetical protein